MAKKKKSLLWSFVKGTGRAIAYVGKGIGRGIKKGVEVHNIRSNPVYSVEAKVEGFTMVKKIKGDYDSFVKRLANDSLIVLVFGRRGSGKSALGFRILENIHAETKRKCFVLGMEKIVFPKWITSVQDVDDVENNGVLLVDEGAISFSSRESMSKNNKDLSKLLAIARHKNLTVLFITQNTGMVDKNILKLSDLLLIKQGSLLQQEMERAEIQKFYKQAEVHMNKLSGDMRQYVYLIDSDFEGIVSHTLPSFWSEKISKNRA